MTIGPEWRNVIPSLSQSASYANNADTRYNISLVMMDDSDVRTSRNEMKNLE